MDDGAAMASAPYLRIFSKSPRHLAARSHPSVSSSVSFSTVPRFLKAFLFVLAIPVSLLAAPASGVEREFVVKGSDTMANLMRHWARAYSELHPNLNVQVTGGGTGAGMAALVNQTADICMASRPIRPDEAMAAIKAFLRRPVTVPVATDALVIYVHETNPVREMTLSQLAGIFTGRVRNWRDLGGPNAAIALYNRESSSGTHEFFKQRVMEGRDFAVNTQTLPGTAAVLEAVSRDPFGIGYGGIGSAEGTRPLALRESPDGEEILPTIECIRSGRYPVSRELRLYLNPARFHGALADFVGWTQSEAGQAVALEAGYQPRPSPLNSEAPEP